MTDNQRFIQAKFVLDQGDLHQARKILSELIKEEPGNLEYWLWLSTAVESRKERIFCLRKALEIDPGNQTAQRGLLIFEGRSQPDLKPVELTARDWSGQIEFAQPKQPKQKEKKRKRFQSRYYYVLAGAVGLLLILLVSGVLFPGQGSIFSPRLTITPMTWTPSVNPNLVENQSATPNPILKTPIGEALAVPYTPTVVYVNTPHARYGSYQTAMDAYQRGDFQTMLTYMRQTADQLETPDIVYLVGEALRNLERFEEAEKEYDRVLFLDPEFAPAYLSRALVQKVYDPEADIKENLDSAIRYDESFGEAYIERAGYYLKQNDYQAAFADAAEAVSLRPESHIAHQYYAEAAYGLGQYQLALEEAERTLEIDINHVPTYFLLGKLYQRVGQPGKAIAYLTKYGPYDDNKSWEYYGALGQAIYQTGGNLEQAQINLDAAIAANKGSADLYLTRSKVKYELGLANEAVTDAYAARDLDRNDLDVTLYLGKLLLETEQSSMAEIYLRISEDLTEDPDYLAEIYFWRAHAREQNGRFEEAQSDWQLLTKLPAESVPEEWLITAVEKLRVTITPTLPQSDTPTPTPTATPTATETPTSVTVPSETNTPSPTSE
jgi:tetratricopeptide (TPR) repeat protein